MAGDRCTVSQMADVIMEGLEEYAQLAADDMKKAVKKAGAQARKDIQENAPVKTGVYAKSWAAKTTKETANAMEIVVYSRNRYQLAHLLEFGHALRKGLSLIHIFLPLFLLVRDFLQCQLRRKNSIAY